MYGGHITDDFDRLLCASYLDKFMSNDLFEGLELFSSPNGGSSGFHVPGGINHTKMMEFIEDPNPDPYPDPNSDPTTALAASTTALAASTTALAASTKPK